MTPSSLVSPVVTDPCGAFFTESSRRPSSRKVMRLPLRYEPETSHKAIVRALTSCTIGALGCWNQRLEGKSNQLTEQENTH